ncbi:MAG: DUF3443 family protein [Burkholderiaceae bacterium]|nr:DUF3443 family protein [Burkholderiaceae bacterium]
MMTTPQHPFSLRLLAIAAVFSTALLLGACGGGGSAGSDTPAPVTPAPGTTAPNTPTYNTDLSAISPGNNTNLGGTAGLPTASGNNVVAVSIRQLASNTNTLTANSPYVTVTVCTSDGSTANCQTIPDVLVDTGSAGLRLFYGALNSTMQSTLPTISTGGGTGTLAACAQFASGYMWGSMRQAVVKIGSMATATAIPIQLMSDAALPPAPSACTNQGGTDFSSSFVGIANGILGISNFKDDCGSGCATNPNNGVYFACNSSSCGGVAVTTAQQGTNPIVAFPTDNNGSILALPGVPLPNGAASTSGALIFGIGTRSNNTLSGGGLYPLNVSGNLQMTVNGASRLGFVDSGSNGYYLALGSVPTCSSGFYCPTQPFSLSTSLQLANQTDGPVQSIVIGNAQDMFKTKNTALPALAGTAAIGGLVDLGLPFFYGRSIATGLEGTNASAPNGYLAY